MDWGTELAKEILLREATEAGLRAELRLLERRVAAIEGLPLRLAALEGRVVPLAEEALSRRCVIEEGAEVFHRLHVARAGRWLAVREHVVDLRTGDRSLRVPAWLVTDGERYWSEPTALLATVRPATSGRRVGLLSGLVATASRWVSGLLHSVRAVA